MLSARDQGPYRFVEQVPGVNLANLSSAVTLWLQEVA